MIVFNKIWTNVVVMEGEWFKIELGLKLYFAVV